MDNEFNALEGKTGSRYWKSLDDLADTPAFQEWAEREFPQGASELQGFNRRHFMKIMAASFGLAGVGLTGCRRPKHEILPYVQQPENIIPGVPQFYSSSHPTPWENVPVVVETHQARPTKIEGNPSYLAGGGATDSFTQASVLDLYDPSRAKRNVRGPKSLDRAAVKDLLANWSGQMASTQGAGFAFLAEHSTSPSRRALVADLKKKFPKAIWSEYEPLDYSAADRASETYWGEPVRVINDYSKASRVLSVGSDFMGTDPGSTEATRSFSRARKVDDPKKADQMNRLYVVEGDFSLSGAAADHRLRLSASQHEAFLIALAQELLSLGAEGNGDIAGLVRGMPVDDSVPLDWVNACAKDLYDHQGESVLVVSPGAEERVQWIAFFINELLGAPGNTQRLLKLPASQAVSIQDLAKELKAGKVDTLFILGGNPVYNAPADLNWPLVQQQAGEVVRFGYWNDETSASTGTHLLVPHYLETWSDGETRDGTLVPVQPMIEPLMDSFSEIEILASLCGKTETDPYAIVQATYAKRSGNGGAGFATFLAVGVLPESGYDEIKPSVAGGGVIAALNANPAPAPGVVSAKNLEVLFTPSSHTLDGRYANNGWMMECPDSMTKLTWDNAILISPRLAKELQEESGLEIFQDPNVMTETGQLQRNTAQFKRGKEQALVGVLSVNGTELRGPIHVLPGLANYTVVVPVGFGRDISGPVGQGVGFNAYPAMPSTNRWSTTGASLQVTDEVYPLANTQEHWSMEGRALMREGTVEEFAESPDFVSKMGMESHSPPIYGNAKDMPLQQKVTEIPKGGSLYKTPEFTAPQQWGMAIDLNLCTGCNSCVVACQSENNIPIVGKDQVLRGREMHWIRLDRYFASQEKDESGIPEEVQVAFQGMACNHCELAPCETVCPVNATVHDEQGLNVMAYNRCVGTRYCANNCPYKVRRFNFFDWNKRSDGHFYEGPLGPSGPAKPIKMQKNPDVTVRMRGVMEKCTYCVQRIESAKINQKVKAKDSADIKVPDGTIKVACQQVCAADAISFGDITDTESEVYKWKQSPRDYSVLGYLNTRPRTTYLAKLRNPNPSMPKKYRYDQPFGRQNYEERFGHGSGHGEHGEGHGHDSHVDEHGHGAEHAEPTSGKSEHSNHGESSAH
ncbi:TAT-variant-translocated molybdopterin oxidoreductase [Puniceicoccus vermicola]|uniref:TAT-variant-translocated molybdopterin oxidoreductase n=1 Tax=Puniceicoccus vermicola TaxID=388746 RepID=A0A7X1E6X5_9BACT|nr:TAT-variant-translocated molybdopterin oxidoreductase [Puniceicoccus vermicola]MBC2603097.1 TAT-variant-translocated molybdopterin oxidoreductase [Puniceicoccus vermicola]